MLPVTKAREKKDGQAFYKDTGLGFDQSGSVTFSSHHLFIAYGNGVFYEGSYLDLISS